METCGRLTVRKSLCKNNVDYGSLFHTCSTHKTEFEIEADKLHRNRLNKERSDWYKSSREYETSHAYWKGFNEAKQEAARKALEADPSFRDRDRHGQQIVTVNGQYSYTWGGALLEVGDKVMLPGSWLGNGPWEGKVTSVGSTYQGAMSPILSKHE